LGAAKALIWKREGVKTGFWVEKVTIFMSFSFKMGTTGPTSGINQQDCNLAGKSWGLFDGVGEEVVDSDKNEGF
jgi:hypothetical protein